MLIFIFRISLLNIILAIRQYADSDGFLVPQGHKQNSIFSSISSEPRFEQKNMLNSAMSQLKSQMVQNPSPSHEAQFFDQAINQVTQQYLGSQQNQPQYFGQTNNDAKQNTDKIQQKQSIQQPNYNDQNIKQFKQQSIVQQQVIQQPRQYNQIQPKQQTQQIQQTQAQGINLSILVNTEPQRQIQSFEAQKQINSVLQEKLLEQQKFQEKLLMQQKINEEVQRQVKEKLKIIEEQKLEAQKLEEAKKQEEAQKLQEQQKKSSDLEQLIQKEKQQSQEISQQNQQQEQKQEQKQDTIQVKEVLQKQVQKVFDQQIQKTKQTDNQNKYQIMDDAYFLKDDLMIKLLPDLNLTWQQIKGILNTSKKMVRTCGSGLKLCMTSLGGDLLSEFNLQLFDFTTTQINEQNHLSIKNDDYETSRAFDQIMSD